MTDAGPPSVAGDLLMTDFDVAIVGAGPAGMSAACCLAESGYQVVVLDENPEPRRSGVSWSRAGP
ncbi:MAG: hypothetical protein CM1200mP20_05640 [Pseudomonadota bacterium]|nr:MAG: hypothetical protein CM1200mP20_05640 [Pseudomonadota bacterium]